MKAVKWIVISLLALMVVTIVSSCDKDEYESQLRELIVKNLTFEPEGGTHSTSYRTENLTNYEAVSDVDWCDVKVDIESSPHQITVTVDENNSFDERVATITLYDKKDTSVSRTFTVTQKQNNVVRISESSYLVASKGGELVIQVEHNVSYSVSTDVDWITIPGNGTRGLQVSDVVLQVEKNNSGAQRMAVVTVRNTETGDESQCLVTQLFTPEFKVLTSDLEIDELGGTVKIQVVTNTTFDCMIPPEYTWLSRLEREYEEGTENVYVPISVTEYTQKDDGREGIVILNCDDTNSSNIEIAITQTRNLYIKESEISLNGFETKSLTLVNKKELTVVWSSSDESVATVDADGNVTGGAQGTAVITVKSSDGRYSDTATVTVGGSFKLMESEYTIDELGGTVDVLAKTNLTQLDVQVTEGSSWLKVGAQQSLTGGIMAVQIVVDPYSEKSTGREASLTVNGEPVTITQFRNLFIQESNITLEGITSKALTLHNANNETVMWASSDEDVVTVDDKGVVTSVDVGTAIVTVSSVDGVHTDRVLVTVERAKDLKDALTYDWQPYYETIGDSVKVTVVSGLDCTLTNKSNFTIVLKKCTLYYDLVQVSVVNYNQQSGTLAPYESKKASFGNLTQQAESSEDYLIVWEYTYSGEDFTYRCSETGSYARKKARTRRR